MRALKRFVAILLILGVASPAWAAPPSTETITNQDMTLTVIDTPFCEPGATHEIALTFNEVTHVTEFDDGRVHFTFTQTGTFDAVPLEPGEQAATGHFAVWGGFNNNGKTVNGTFTFNANGTLEDGTRVSTHLVDHFNVTPSGSEFFFTRCHE